MEQQLKQRLLGTFVLIAGAVIVLPLLLDGDGYRALQGIIIDAPQRPSFKYQQKDFTIPLQNSNDGILNPPQPMDIKAFDDTGEPKTEHEADNTTAENATPPTSPPELSTWVVQVGSFSIEDNAIAARKKLLAMNVKNTVAEIESKKVNGLDVYVVKIVSDDYEILSGIMERIKTDYPDAFIKEEE